MTDDDGQVGLDTATRFRHAFRRHPAGVALVTAATADGFVGLTASSVASVSADPAVVSFSVSRSSGSAAGLLAAGEVSVHLLPASRLDLAEDFSRPGARRFTAEQGWTRQDDGGLRLPDALATLSGPIRATIPVGAATVVLLDVGEVVLGRVGDPLVHHDRTFRRLGAPLHRRERGYA